MKEIGGYLELELGKVNPDYRFAHTPLLNSGRHALEFMLMQYESIPSKIYLPYYTCEVVLEPIKRLGIPYDFYHINGNLEIDRFPDLKKGEVIIVNNYFGIKDSYVDELFLKYGDSLIVDDAQALFHMNHLSRRHFYSPRKFVGVPDGGIAWTPQTRDISLEESTSVERSLHLLKRIDSGAQSGLEEFRKNDCALSKETMKGMSSLTKHILHRIDYEEVRFRRRSNFETLHMSLAQTNDLSVPDMGSFACPMIYPYLTEDKSLRNRLIENKIFVATYWPNVLEWCGEHSLEHTLARNLIPLPVDQRYGEEDMIRIINVITNKS